MCVAVALVASTCGAVIYIHRLHSQTAKLVTDSVTKLRTAEELAFAMRDVRSNLYQFALSGDPSIADGLPQLGHHVAARLDQAELNATSLQERRYVADLKADFRRVRQLINDIGLHEAPGDRRKKARELGDILTHQTMVLCELFLDDAEQAIEQAEAQHRSNILYLQYLVVLTGLLIPLIGVAVGYLVSRSVTRELQRSREELLRSEQLAALGRLAAGMAHELRNPLTSIMMMVQTADADEPADLQVIEDEVRRMERTLQACLDFAKPREPQRALCDLRDIVGDACRLLEARLRRQQLEFVVETPPEPVVVLVDRQHLHQVVVNLLLNAMEGTGTRGSLGITIAANQKQGMATLTVWDNGRGFPPELLPKAFEPFVTGKPNGTGLGLSVCRQIAERHGGQIEARNRPHGGAEVTITLPWQGLLQPTDVHRPPRRPALVDMT